MNTVEVLEAARKKIENPEHWTQFMPAKDRLGNLASVDGQATSTMCPAAAALSEVCGWHIAHWNNALARTHAEVLDAFDAAIANEKAKLS